MTTTTLAPVDGLTEIVGADLTVGDVMLYLGDWRMVTGFSGHRVCPVLGGCRVARCVNGPGITIADTEPLTVAR